MPFEEHLFKLMLDLQSHLEVQSAHIHNECSNNEHTKRVTFIYKAICQTSVLWESNF